MPRTVLLAIVVFASSFAVSAGVSAYGHRPGALAALPLADGQSVVRVHAERWCAAADGGDPCVAATVERCGRTFGRREAPSALTVKCTYAMRTRSGARRVHYSSATRTHEGFRVTDAVAQA